MIKKITKIFILLLCVLCSTVAFAGCNRALKNGPELNSVVYGNGGLAVVKGDYVYYVNGYTQYSNVTSSADNKYGKVKKSAIYRTKLNNGKLEYTYNEKDTEQKYSNTLTLTEVVASKVAGHENTKLFIYDNNIYYSSPNTDKDKEGNVKNEYLDFYVSNINGTGNKHIYKTQTSSSNQTFTFTKIGKTVYLVCYDGTNLNIINTASKTVKTVSNAVTGVAFKENSTYNSVNYSISEVDTYVYYTRANADENATGNVLARVKIDNPTEEIISQDTAKTCTLIGFAGKDVYYSVVNSSINSNVKVICKSNVQQKTEQEVVTDSFNSTYAFEYTDNTTGVIGVKDSGVYVVNANGASTQLYSGSAKVCAINNGYAYLLEDTSIYKVDILNGSNKLKVSGDFNVDTTIENNYMSVASIYTFFYAEYEGEEGTVHYLTMANTTFEEDGVCTPSFIGEFIGKDKPVEEYEE